MATQIPIPVQMDKSKKSPARKVAETLMDKFHVEHPADKFSGLTSGPEPPEEPENPTHHVDRKNEANRARVARQVGGMTTTGREHKFNKPGVPHGGQ